ncbi:conserved oligomeric Golgi complex subunit 8-like [Schistocerca gregaria]|uniref:conserved oligomeric Golgi complex subunit 8-like n=1 Tax=Schistocerca gregaria TaxID=7010 RepID=UPI00211F0A3A|nr:conserved oligomeric Golgi complex subunit 8-like [Schistocerca gregaria]
MTHTDDPPHSPSVYPSPQNSLKGFDRAFELHLPGLDGKIITEDTFGYAMDLIRGGADFTRREAERLKGELYQIRRSRERLSIQNLDFFMQSISCAKALSTEARSLSENLKILLRRWSDLKELFTCQKICRELEDLNKVRQDDQKASSYHYRILEILEVPQLIRKCIDSQLYAQALKLDCHFMKLACTHSNVPIFSTVARDVNLSVSIMQKRLERRLEHSTELLDGVQIIEFLREMGTYTECELCVTFLKRRQVYLKSLAESISMSDDLIEYMGKICREWREVRNQYRAAFPRQEEVHLIYNSWMINQLSQFLTLFKEKISNISHGADLSCLLSQCLLLSSSTKKYGIDLEGLLIPIFEEKVIDFFSQLIHSSIQIYFKQLEKYHSTISQIPADYPVADPSLPPVEFLEYLPIAHLTNALLLTFNEVQPILLYSIKTEITYILEKTLQLVLDKQASIGIERISNMVTHVFIPYILSCYDVLWESESGPT